MCILNVNSIEMLQVAKILPHFFSIQSQLNLKVLAVPHTYLYVFFTLQCSFYNAGSTQVSLT